MAIRTVDLENIGSATPVSIPRTATKSRLLYLDNLRMVIITAVVLGHLSVTYGVDADWIYYEGGEASPIVNILTLMIMAIGIGFSLGLFFLIAGYFTPPAYDRKGMGKFLIDRLKKLGIPWLFYEIVINPLIHYAVDVHGGDCLGALYDCQYQGSFWQYLKEFPQVSGSFGDGPVWFLEALLLFSIVYALWRVVRHPLNPLPPASPNRFFSTVPSNRTIFLFALFIGLSTFIVRFWAKAFVQYEPFHLEFARFPQYIALFIAGIWAYRGGWLAAFSDRQAKTWRWIALGCVLTLPVLFVALGTLSGTFDERGFSGVNWLSLSYSVWEGFLCVAMVITVLTWFRTRFLHQNRLVKIMAEGSFAVFVLHPAVIVPLTLALSTIRMNLSLKFLIVAPIALVICYTLAYGLRRIPLARSILS